VCLSKYITFHSYRFLGGESVDEDSCPSSSLNASSSPAKTILSQPSTPTSGEKLKAVDELKQKIRQSLRKGKSQSSLISATSCQNLSSKPPPRPWSLKLRQTSTCPNCKMASLNFVLFISILWWNDFFSIKLFLLYAKLPLGYRTMLY
jgi:hypothetical protein